MATVDSSRDPTDPRDQLEVRTPAVLFPARKQRPSCTWTSLDLILAVLAVLCSLDANGHGSAAAVDPRRCSSGRYPLCPSPVPAYHVRNALTAVPLCFLPGFGTACGQFPDVGRDHITALLEEFLKFDFKGTGELEVRPRAAYSFAVVVPVSPFIIQLLVVFFVVAFYRKTRL
jgi:hypothetical protein